MREDGQPRNRARKGLVGLALFLAGCGRLGFDLLPSPTSSVSDGGGGAAGPSDASIGGSAGNGGAPSGGAGGSVGGAGGSLGGSGGSGGGSGGIRDAGSGGVTDTSTPRCSSPSRPVADYCTHLPRLPDIPTFDGLVDCGLETHPMPMNGVTGDTSGTSAEYAVAWRPNGLYFFVSVKDGSLLPSDVADPADFGDAVELFVDSDGASSAAPAYDDPGTRRFVVSAPENQSASRGRADVDAFGVTGFPKTWTSTLFRAFPFPGGYTVEAFIVGQDLGIAIWTLGANDVVGIDLGVDASFGAPDASGASGHRAGRFFAAAVAAAVDAAVSGTPDGNAAAFCSPVLDP